VCTNKREYLSRKLLEALGLQYYFHSVAGPQHVRRVEAGPGHVAHVIALAGAEPSHAIMVGDSHVDISTAKRARVPSILVSYGYAPEALHELAPDATFDHSTSSCPRPPLSSALRRPNAGIAKRTVACHRFAQFRPDCSQRRATVESHLSPASSSFAGKLSKGDRRC
jgi:hypothetical protein